jgi:hypothetical protein
MFLLAFSICSCLPPSVDRCFSTSTAYTIQGFVPVLSEWKNPPPRPPSGCAHSYVSSPFCTLACRFGCLLPLLSGFSYLFTVVDKTTRWVEAFLLSFGAANCAAALLQGWIQWLGVLSTITIDRGPQFTSQLWASLCMLLTITHVQTTAHHPQANGLVERLHLCLKDALRARSAVADWRSHMPWVMLGIRTTWREDSEFLPAENVFGSQLVLPGQFLSAPESPSLSFLSDFKGLLAGRVPQFTTCCQQVRFHYQRISSCQGLCWSIKMESSRLYHRSIQVPSWSLSGASISSNCRSEIRSTPFPVFV